MNHFLMAALITAHVRAAEPIAVRSTDIGKIRVETRGNDLTLVIRDGSDTLSCQANKNSEWTTVGAFASKVANYQTTENQVEFGNAKDSAIDQITQYPGWCNVSATLRGDKVTLVFVRVRACFGTAGCNRDYAASTLTRTELSELGTYLSEFAQHAGKTTHQAESKKANAVLTGSLLALVALSAGLAFWSLKDVL